jgi:PAS domain S-box-containing protein
VTFIALVPVAFLAGLLRTRLARGSVLPLLVALESGTPLDEAIRAALGDPSLRIAYWLGARERWVDAEGREIAEPAPDGGRSVSMVERHGERVAALVHDRSLDDAPAVVRGVAAAAALALEAQRAQAELRNQLERFRAVVESAPVAIVEIGLDEKVNLWNPAAERIFGWSAEEVLGRPPRWVPEDLWEDFRALSEREALGGSYTGYETVRVDRDGRRLDVEISAAPITDGSGEVVGAMAVLNDISDRRRQEEEVRASRARIVQAADDARRELERNLHDGAQQRLVALSVSLRLAEAKLSSDPAAAASILTDAREELAHALEELRELARGIHPAVLTERGLAAAVDALVARSPVPVEVELPEERLPPAIEAALYYVIAESLANVAKYAGASAARVRLAVSDGRLAVLEVSDDGVGGADPARGSGLRGLADRVESLDGTLSVESPPGGGTCVRVAIPLAPAHAG